MRPPTDAFYEGLDSEKARAAATGPQVKAGGGGGQGRSVPEKQMGKIKFLTKKQKKGFTRHSPGRSAA